ncbi:hypothetical protein B6V74_04985 [Thioclava sp. F42-5]|nr:hypothetical protein B6V74_04985 [Thioclava sp. F42-5]
MRAYPTSEIFLLAFQSFPCRSFHCRLVAICGPLRGFPFFLGSVSVIFNRRASRAPGPLFVWLGICRMPFS